MRIVRILLILLMAHISWPDICAQDFCAGARARAMGNTGVADTSAWSLWNNPSGLSRLSEYHAIISDERLYGISEIKSFSAGIIVPFNKQYVAGISLQKQGYEFFNDQQIGIHLAHAIGIYSISASFVLWQRVAGDYFRELYPMLNIGGIMVLNRSVQLGLHLTNTTNTQNEAETIPFQLKAGILYKVSKQVLVYGDLVKNSNEILHLRTGLEYHIHTHFYLRTGIMTKPLRMNGGFGFKNKKCAVDYSLSWQQPLGYRHQLSVLISLKKQP
ncbi:MAG: hypothetical protein H7259_02960 [Cytophagales bacterium]|nr:hypothetical protein [Cytophaga sp.]